MIEGGGQVAASALSSGVVQKIAFFYAPKILGSEGLPAIGKTHVERLSDVLGLDGLKAKRLGADLLVEGYPTASSSHHGFNLRRDFAP